MTVKTTKGTSLKENDHADARTVYRAERFNRVDAAHRYILPWKVLAMTSS